MASQKRINGRTYKMEPILATRAVQLQIRVIKYAGPIIHRLPEILPALRGEEKAQGAALSAGASAIMTAFGSVEPDEFAGFMTEVCQMAEVVEKDGTVRKVDFDRDFSGNLMEAFEVAFFVLKDIFGPFFSGLSGSGGRGTTAAA